MTPPGSAGTASDGYRIPVKEGRHRAPPEPPPPDRWTAPIAAAAAILTFASLIALYAPGLAPDATAAGRHGVTVSTAARSARTVSVPLEILPAPTPTIGAEGAWDPETDTAVFAGTTTTTSAPTGAREATQGVTRTPDSTPEAVSDELVAIPDPPTTEQQPATQPEADEDTTAPPVDEAAPTDEDSSEPTEEPTVPTDPTATPTVPADIQDVIDQALEDALGETP